MHNEVRGDILRDDAARLSATINRDLIPLLVRLNFGADLNLPDFLNATYRNSTGLEPGENLSNQAVIPEWLGTFALHSFKGTR